MGQPGPKARAAGLSLGTMSAPTLILASGSPRRRRLLHLAGHRIDEICPPNVPEVRQPGEAPIQYARRLSAEKATAVDRPNAWVLAADTVVHQGEEIFEKPTNDADAVRMLTRLSGGGHEVTTAWCLRWGGPDPVLVQGHQTSAVFFRQLTNVEISRYVATGEGQDKAGAYAIQGDGASLITKVDGSTTNVIGLPLEDVLPALNDAGLTRESV